MVEQSQAALQTEATLLYKIIRHELLTGILKDFVNDNILSDEDLLYATSLVSSFKDVEDSDFILSVMEKIEIIKRLDNETT